MSLTSSGTAAVYSFLTSLFDMQASTLGEIRAAKNK
jgi:hypothetical protein